MRHLNLTWPANRQRERFVEHEVLAPGRLPVSTFLPTGYEPNYPYPLMVLFHPRGGDEQRALSLAPRFSERNYVCIGLRGPKHAPVRGEGAGAAGYSWGTDGRFDGLLEEYVFRAVEQTRRLYHVHSERIYLAGLCEGSLQAYRLALAYPERFAGVISLNGTLPQYGTPLFRWPAVRQLRAFVGHGMANPFAPLSLARRDFRLLYTAGLDVTMSVYPATHRLHPAMFRDVNRWIMDAVNAE